MYHLGRANLAEGRTDPAIEALERAVRLEASNAAHHAWLGNAYGQKARNANVVRQATLASRAKGAFERAVQLDPDNVDGRMGLIQFHLIAPGLMGGDRKLARQHADELKRRNHYQGAAAWVQVHNAERNPAGVVAELEPLLTQYPDSARMVVGLVLAYDQLGKHQDAYNVLDAMLRRRPNEMSIAYQLGRLGAVSGLHMERAERELRRYLQHEPEAGQPSLAAAHWRLGMIYERQGRVDQARAEYMAAQAKDPRHRESRDALRKLGG